MVEKIGEVRVVEVVRVVRVVEVVGVVYRYEEILGVKRFQVQQQGRCPLYGLGHAASGWQKKNECSVTYIH